MDNLQKFHDYLLITNMLQIRFYKAAVLIKNKVDVSKCWEPLKANRALKCQDVTAYKSELALILLLN